MQIQTCYIYVILFNSHDSSAGKVIMDDCMDKSSEE